MTEPTTPAVLTSGDGPLPALEQNPAPTGPVLGEEPAEYVRPNKPGSWWFLALALLGLVTQAYVAANAAVTGESSWVVIFAWCFVAGWGCFVGMVIGVWLAKRNRPDPEEIAREWGYLFDDSDLVHVATERNARFVVDARDDVALVKRTVRKGPWIVES